MACLAAPVYLLIGRCSGRFSVSREGYRPLTDDVDDQVTVVVGRERREFMVDSFVLEESPFRVLIEMAMKANHTEKRALDVAYGATKRVIYVDVDAILFEHMLWLMYNDCSTFLKLNVKEIIDFYTQDI